MGTERLDLTDSVTGDIYETYGDRMEFVRIDLKAILKGKVKDKT